MHFAEWTQQSTPDETLEFLKELALSHASEGGEQGKYIASCITSGDFRSLCDFGISYADCSAFEAASCRQAVDFFSKLESLVIEGAQPRDAAVKKFLKAEEACRETNEIFSMVEQGSFHMEPWVSAVLHGAMQKISRVLGDVPQLASLGYRFGPGATTLTKKRSASLREKLQAGISCSEDLLPYAARHLEQMPSLVSLLETESSPWVEIPCDDPQLRVEEAKARVPVRITHGVVDFVRKKATADRAIIKEGSLNTLVQLALGDHITSRLAAFGVDLKDQSKNQKLAREGSLYGSYATLDLSSASDTIATKLVSHLLPFGWFTLLNSCRSSTVVLDGAPIRLEKFSSMGNGFTFPLESLIFWALVSSLEPDSNFASVYGDDIIVPTHLAERAIRILQICGFELNMEKSFWTGPFRESCGADYFNGMDIRPYYQKKLISPEELFKLHNYYVRSGDPERAQVALKAIPSHLRLFGPDGYGDGHLLGAFPPRRKPRQDRLGFSGTLFDTFKHISRYDRRALCPGDRILPLYTIYRRGSTPVFDRLPPLPDSPIALASFLRIFRRGRVERLTYAPLEMPERTSPVDGVVYKTPTYPGTEGYKRVTIYTFL